MGSPDSSFLRDGPWGKAGLKPGANPRRLSPAEVERLLALEWSPQQIAHRFETFLVTLLREVQKRALLQGAPVAEGLQDKELEEKNKAIFDKVRARVSDRATTDPSKSMLNTVQRIVPRMPKARSE